MSLRGTIAKWQTPCQNAVLKLIHTQTKKIFKFSLKKPLDKAGWLVYNVFVKKHVENTKNGGRKMENGNEKSRDKKVAGAERRKMLRAMRALSKKLAEAEAELEKSIAKKEEASERAYRAFIELDECLSQSNEILGNDNLNKISRNRISSSLSKDLDSLNGISEYLDRLVKLKEKDNQAEKELLIAKKECEKAEKNRIEALKAHNEMYDLLGWGKVHVPKSTKQIEPRTK